MFIFVDVEKQKLQVDCQPAISCEGWHYLRSLSKFRKLFYDTRAKQGLALWYNPTLPPAYLANPVYESFVDQLISAVITFTGYNNVIYFPSLKEDTEGHRNVT